MPPTGTRGSDVFKISVAAPPRWSFSPGDTIIGDLVRAAPIVAPEATVKLALFGRVKTKISEKRNNRRHEYRGRWNLLDESWQVVFSGPLHLAPGSGEEKLLWPFSITIPTRPTGRLAVGHVQEESFLPLDANTIANHGLPGSYGSSSTGFTTDSECFVEYWLEAQLRYSRKGSWEVHKATVPITMRHSALISGFPGYDLQKKNFERRVKSQRLLPGMENAELSFKQKTQKFFHSSKVPEFYYRVEITSPRVIQLNNPSPLPFTIAITPLSDRTTSEIREIPQNIQLDWVTMIVNSKTDVIAPGNLSERNTHSDNQSRKFNLGLRKVFHNLQAPIMLSAKTGAEPVDIGHMLQLVLRSNGLSMGDRLLSVMINMHPDFLTFNIRHVHAVEWELSLTLAGERHRLKVKTPLKILPAN